MQKHKIQKLVNKSFTDKSLKQEALLYFRSVMSDQTIDKQEVVLDDIRYHCKSIIEKNNQISEEDLFIIFRKNWWIQRENQSYLWDKQTH